MESGRNKKTNKAQKAFFCWRENDLIQKFDAKSSLPTNEYQKNSSTTLINYRNQQTAKSQIKVGWDCELKKFSYISAKAFLINIKENRSKLQ